MNDLFDISKKTVIITGGAGVLGVEIAKNLAIRGAYVTILDVDLKLAESIAQQMQRQGLEFHAVYGNVMDVSILKDAAEKILKMVLLK